MEPVARRPKARTWQEAEPALPLGTNQPSVLVVEADPEVQVQMARSLRNCGLRVVGTSSGDGALALLSEWTVDLILVSEDLPGRSGIEVVRSIHRLRPHTRCVVLATTNEDEVREAARQAGAVGCVAKPLRVDSLSRWLSPLTIPRLASQAVAE